MKYILLLGLYFKKYKNNFKLRIYADDHYIDEIVLKEETLGKDIHYTDELWRDRIPFLARETFIPVPGSESRKFPNKMFIFEIDDSILNDKITFEMNDTNSNDTNCFMTDSNMIMFDEIYLFPKDLLAKRNFDRFIKMYSRRWSLRGLYNTWLLWPGVDTLWEDGIPINKLQNWIGGVRKLHIPLIKKFGTCLLSPDKKEYYKKKYKYTVSAKFVAYLHLCNLLNTHDENQ
jgi:hypothetical protein